jgi:hypothetical protein
MTCTLYWNRRGKGLAIIDSPSTKAIPTCLINHSSPAMVLSPFWAWFELVWPLQLDGFIVHTKHFQFFQFGSPFNFATFRHFEHFARAPIHAVQQVDGALPALLARGDRGDRCAEGHYVRLAWCRARSCTKVTENIGERKTNAKHAYIMYKMHT